MPIQRLNFQVRAAATPSRRESLAFTSTNLSRPYFPARGIPYSLVIHVIVFTGLYFLAMLRGPTEGFARRLERLRSLERPVTVKSLEDRVVMYLPILGGGSQGMGLAGSGSGSRRKKPSVVPASSTRGFSYPGPQPIVSDVPDPTNRIQTLLQPALKNPPILKPPLSLPNIVQTADAGPVQQPSPPEAVKPAEQQPAVPPAAQPEAKPTPPVVLPVELLPPTAELPKLLWPARGTQDTLMPKVKTAEPPQPVPPSRAIQDLSLYKETAPSEPPPQPVVETKIQPTSTTLGTGKEPPALEFSPVQTRGPDSQNLLALTPMPAVIQKGFELPVGEARGRFAISPEPNLDAPETEPGSKLEISPLRAGIGSNATSPVGEGAAGNATQTGAATGSGTGKGSGPGTGAGTLPGVGGGSTPGPGIGSGTGAGTGSGPGTGIGSGSGSGLGPGTGAGSGPGKGPFRGITIVGGVEDTGAPANPAPIVRTRRPLQTSWGITVISTENSGGGLPDFGVFSHEQVYTVYLDMRETETDTVPSWTLEFAVVHGTAFQSIAPENPSQSQQGLVLPFPIVKERPSLPAELVRKYLHRMIVVYAIINADGKLEQMSVKQSPDTSLNEPLLNALSKWVFRPARLNGQAVAAKALLGIPLWLPQQ